jgi:hypothetical protein
MTTFTAEIPSDLLVQECLQTKKVLKGLRPLGSVEQHSLHTRGVSSSNLLAGTIFSITYGRRRVARFGPHTLSHTL